MEAQNDISALQMLSKNDNFTMRWFVFGAGADHHDNSPTIEPMQQAVKAMRSDLGRIAFRFDNSGGGLITAITADPWEGVGRFPFNWRETR